MLDHLNLKDAHFFNPVRRVVGHENNGSPGLQLSVKDTKMHHGAAVRVVVGIKDQGFERPGGITGRCRQPGDNCFQYGFDAGAFLGGNQQGLVRVQAEIFGDLHFYPFDVRRGQIDFIDDRNDLQIVFHGQVEIGQGLGFDPLAGINQQQGSLAGSQGTRYFIGKIHMPGCVDEV